MLYFKKENDIIIKNTNVRRNFRDRSKKRHKKYGKFTAVDKISFKINDGEIIGLLRTKWCWKKYYNEHDNRIHRTNRRSNYCRQWYDISKRPKKQKSQIGYMPEGVPLYSDLTVKEFVRYMAELKKVDKKRKEKVEKIIEQTGLKNVEKKINS